MVPKSLELTQVLLTILTLTLLNSVAGRGENRVLGVWNALVELTLNSSAGTGEVAFFCF